MNRRDYFLGYRAYQRNPEDFDEDQINQLFNYAQKNNVPFEYAETDASLGSMVGQLFNGWVQGFTTLPVGEKPTNTIDGIAHSIGHLLGFASIITPGGLMTKAGIKAGTMLGGKTVGKHLSRSIPMQGADFVTKKAAASALGKQAAGAVNSVAGSQAGFAKQLLRHGAHLGVASQVSNIWEDMKDEDLPGFLANSFYTGLSGAAFGASFAAIGNIKLPQAISRLVIKGVSGRDILKASAGAMVQGVPPAMQGATTPENVYNALLGAYFGFKARPWRHEQAFKSQEEAFGGNREVSETDFAYYKKSDYYRNLDKQQREVELETFNNFFNSTDSQAAVANLFNAETTAEPVRKATVTGVHNKYANQNVEVVKEMNTMAQIRVGDEPGLKRIDKKFLRFEEERQDQIVSDESIENFKKKLEDIEVEPGNDSIEIPINRPVESFFKKIIGKDEITSDQYQNNLRSLQKIITEQITEAKETEGVRPWEVVSNKIKEQFKDKNITDTDIGEIRQFYRAATESIPVPRYALKGNEFVEETNFDFNNNRISNLSSPKLIHKIATEQGIVENPSDAYFVVKNVIDYNNFTGRRKQKRISSLKPSEKNKVLDRLVRMSAEAGYYPYSGNSDKVQMIFMKKNLGDFKSEFERIKKDFTAIDPKFASNYTKHRAQAKKNGGLRGSEFDEMFVSNVRWWEAINGNINVKDLYSGEGYLKDVLNFNKRQQPLFSSYYPLTADTFTKPIRYIVTPDTKNTADPGMQKLYNIAKKEGWLEWSDGQVPVRKEIFDLIPKDAGLPEMSGFAKPFMISKDSQHGTLLGKLAFRRASDKLSKAMEDAGIDMYIPTSVAKQYGSRKLMEFDYTESSKGVSQIKFSRRGKPLGEAKLDVTSLREGNRNLLIESQIELNTIKKEQGTNELFVLDRAKTDKNRIGDIRTRDPLTTESKGVGTRIVNAIKNEFISKHSEKNDKSYIEISPNIGTKEKNYRDSSVGFWEKMGFKDTGKKGADGRPLYRYDLKAEIAAHQSQFMRGGSKERVYEMNPSDIVVDWNTKDSSMRKIEKNEQVKVFKQIQEQFMNHDVYEKMSELGIDINKSMNRFMQERFEGDLRSNKFLQEFISKGKSDEKAIKKLDKTFEKIGLDQVIDAMRDRSDAGKAFRELARRKFVRLRSPESEEDSINLRHDWSKTFERQKLTNSEQILENAGTSDAVAMGKRVSEYVDRAMTNYLLTRMLQPKILGGKGIMAMYTPDLVYRTDPYGNTSRLLKEDDIFFLDNNFESMKMPIVTGLGERINFIAEGGKKRSTTLKDQWEMYLAEAKDTKVKKMMEDNMASIISRSPIDGISGVMHLKFAGFTGQQGGGILLHPLAMRRAGGADLDIDSANFYMNSLPREFQQISRAFSKDFNEVMNYVDKTYGSLENLMKDKFIDLNNEPAGKDSYLGMFDPYLRFQTANTIQQASDIARGIAVNAKRDIRILYNAAKRDPRGKFVHKDELGNTVTFVPRKSEMDLKATSMAGVQVTVDVAKYGALYEPAVIKAQMLDAGFSKITVQPKKGKAYNLKLKNKDGNWGTMVEYFQYQSNLKGGASFTDSPIAQFSNTLQKMYGRDKSSGLGWKRNDVLDAAAKHPKWDIGPYAKLAELVQKLDYTDSIYERYQLNVRDFTESMNRLNQMNNRDKEIYRFISTKDFSKTYSVDIGKRMQQLNKYFTPDRLDANYDHWGNLSTTKGIKEFVSNKQTMKEFIDAHEITSTKGKKVNYLKNSKTYKDTIGKKNNKANRETFIRRYIKEVNEFIDNDLEVWTSLKTINDIGTKHNIKPDADLPRYSKKLAEESDLQQLTSLNKWLMDSATQIKNEFIETYKASRQDKRLSANATALDAIYDKLNGDGPTSVKSRMSQAVEFLNANRKETVEPITETGLREMFDAYLMGSLNANKQTRSFFFTPQLVSPNVLRQFNVNKQMLFENTFKDLTISEWAKRFKETPSIEATREDAELSNRILDFEIIKPVKEVKDLKPEIRTLYNKIEKQLLQLSKSAKLNPDEIDKAIMGFFTQRGKGSIKEIDKYDLRGFERYLDEIINGSGAFRKLVRGNFAAKTGSWLSEIDESGKLKNSLWSWLKMTERVGFDQLKNDFNVIDGNARAYAYKTVTKRDPVTGEKYREREYGQYKSWVPQSHFSQMQKMHHGIAQYTEGIRRRLEDETQEIFGSRLITGSKSKKDKMNELIEVAIYEWEAYGTIERAGKEYKFYRDGNYTTEAGQKDQQVFIKRATKDAIPKYKELIKENYTHTIEGKTGQFSAREVINDLKTKIEKDFTEFYTRHIDLNKNFTNDMQKIISKTKSKKAIRFKEGEIDITEIPITYLQKQYVEPLTREGFYDYKDKNITLLEAHFMGREADIKAASLDMTPENTPFIETVLNRKVRDVYKFEDIKHLMKDDNGKNISLFDILQTGKEQNAKFQQYVTKFYNNILRWMNLDAAEDISWRKELKEQWEKYRTLSENQMIQKKAFDAYESYIKERDSYEFSGDNNAIGLVAQVRNYFSRKNERERDGRHLKGFVPFKSEDAVYSQFLHDLALAKRKISLPLWIRQNFRHSPIHGFQPIGKRERYFPHMEYDNAVLYPEIIREAKRINSTSLSPEERTKKIDALFRRYESVIENQMKDDNGLADYAKDSLLLKSFEGDRGIQYLSSMGSDSRPGNMLSRQVNLDGYSRSIDIIGKYKSSVQSAIGTELSAMMSKKLIRDFSKKNPMGVHTKDWEDYMRIFARDMTGAPSTVSQEMLSSKSLNIKRTPWWYTSDQYLYSKKSIHKLVDKLSGRSKPSEFIKQLYNQRVKGAETNGQMELFNPNSRVSFDEWWQSQRATHAIKYDKDGMPVEREMNWFAGQMKNFSQLEGKYQLATLLARMKVVVNNVLGGGTNTWVYTGAKPMRDARNIEIWQSIDPRFKTMKDVDQWVGTHGVVEEMVKYDLGYIGMKKKPNYEAFAQDFGKLMNKKFIEGGKRELYEPTFRELVKKYNVTGEAMEKAAWFMGRSELYLRTNAFKAAYLNQRQILSPVNMELNDPYLIEQSKKAVKASQFLYTAPFRPSFARTSAGKVYSRFKLWAWNSVKFRRDVYKEAKFAGFRPGSAEAKRLERMMTADLFMIGMAKMLPYTMFDYSLPAPYSNFQDIADWAFGSDQQRERAFYGTLPKAIAPVHELMPAILRGPEAIFGNIFSGNWERFADYTLVSHFPFGLLGRDIYMAAQSPALLGEFITGLPLHRMNRLRDDILEDKRAPAYTPGFF